MRAVMWFISNYCVICPIDTIETVWQLWSFIGVRTNENRCFENDLAEAIRFIAMVEIMPTCCSLRVLAE